MNNGKYHTESFKRKHADKLDRIYGPIVDHTKTCQCCGKDFVFKGRINTKEYQRTKFCSRSCANNRQTYWNDNATHYRTIAFKYWEEKCVICGFDKIVAVHHIDENRENNSPHNLIPLCPNHHEMVHHSKWADEVRPLVEAARDEMFTKPRLGD